MSLAVGLGEDRKCSTVGLDLLLGLSMVRRCSLNQSFKRRFALQITAHTLNHVDEVFSFTGQVRFYGARFPGRTEGICCKALRNEKTAQVLPKRKEPGGSWGLVELELLLKIAAIPMQWTSYRIYKCVKSVCPVRKANKVKVIQYNHAKELA